MCVIIYNFSRHHLGDMPEAPKCWQKFCAGPHQCVLSRHLLLHCCIRNGTIFCRLLQASRICSLILKRSKAVVCAPWHSLDVGEWTIPFRTVFIASFLLSICVLMKIRSCSMRKQR